MKSTNDNNQRSNSNLSMQNEIRKREEKIQKLKREIKNLKSQKKNLVQEGKVIVEVRENKNSYMAYRLTTSPRYSKTPELFLKTIYQKSFTFLQRNYMVLGCLNISLINIHSDREEISSHPMTKAKFPILDENDKKTYLDSLPNYFLEKIAHPNLEGSGWRQNGVNYFDLTLIKIK